MEGFTGSRIRTIIMKPSDLTSHQRIVAWQWTHNSIGYDLIRVFIGTALLVRGAWFMLSPDALAELAGDRAIDWTSYYVLIAHLVGGLLLMIGLFTRYAAVIQIPILVSAVFFVSMGSGLASGNQSLELSGLVLVILAVILVFGPGRYSLDYKRFSRGGYVKAPEPRYSDSSQDSHDPEG